MVLLTDFQVPRRHYGVKSKCLSLGQIVSVVVIRLGSGDHLMDCNFGLVVVGFVKEDSLIRVDTT